MSSSDDNAAKVDPSDIVPHLAAHKITYADLETSIRVLTAVAALTPSRSGRGKRKVKDKGSNGEDNEDNGCNINSNNNDDEELDLDDLLKPYKDSSLRPFRKVLAKCIDLHQMTMFNGKNKNDYYRERDENRSLKRQKLSERDMQRKHIANTALRRGRIERLREKQMEGQEEETTKLLMIQQQENADAASAVVSNSNTTTPTLPSLMMVPDGHVETTPMVDSTNGGDGAAGTAAGGSENGVDSTIKLPKLRSCYVCKTRFRDLHHFYDQLCPSCAEMNWQKRHQTCDLSGQVAVVTGCRVKIGYQTCLKLLRAGATVIATTRFPNAAVATYRKERDFDEWKDRLQVFGLDLRDVTGIEVFCRFLKTKCGEKGLDVLINNACQTIRRPREYYLPACEREEQLWKEADDTHKFLLVGCREFEGIRRQLIEDQKRQCNNSFGSGPRMNLLMTEENKMPPNQSSDNHHNGTIVNNNVLSTSSLVSTTKSENGTITATSTTMTRSDAPFETTGISHSAAASQMILLPEDVGVPESVLPKGATDINGQQLDLRQTNSWLLKLDEVSTPEVMECMFVNAIAPFVLNSRLKPLMCTPATHGNRYIVNVSAMEGKFYRYKLPSHPHTNMAKAAMNMMTRTAAEDLATNHMIYMNAIDTGWINDENPLERAKKTAERNHFQTPIDEIDAAARIVDPIFCQSKDFGKFLKDYRESEW
jgi:NAD(P)-dependent dehydrogenase (short-subunit alcohol dehydrogenase family)